MIDGAMSGYILNVAVCGTVGVVYRSCVGWCRGVTGIWKGICLGGFRYVGWDRNIFCQYMRIFYRGVFARFKFQVGLADGAR